MIFKISGVYILSFCRKVTFKIQNQLKNIFFKRNKVFVFLQLFRRIGLFPTDALYEVSNSELANYIILAIPNP